MPAPTSSFESHRSLVTRLFSFPVAIVFLLFLTLFFGGSIERNIAEPDIWWHLRNADHLVSTHSFPRFDEYTFTAAGSPWIPHEWLSEIVYYAAFRAWGLRGIFTVYLALTAFIFLALYYLCCRSGANPKTASIAALLGILLASVSFGPRMLLFGWAFLVILLIILQMFSSNRSGLLWLIPPLFCVWINLHGSWFFGMLVLGIFIASGLVQGEWGTIRAERFTSAELKKLLTVAGLAVAALFVNPFGYRPLSYPFDLLFRQPMGINTVEEWMSVDFHTAHGKVLMLLLLTILGVALISRRSWKLYEVLLGAFALYSALTYTRMQFFAALIFVPLLAVRLPLFPPYDERKEKPLLNAAIMVAVVAIIMVSFPSEARLQEKIRDKYPEAAVAFMERNQIHDRVFNDYLWGGYLIWHAPQTKVFIDGRADLFDHNGVFADYTKIINIQGPLELLDQYRIQYALLQPQGPVPYVLAHSSCWIEIYNDKVAVVYQRKPDAARCNLTAASSSK